MMRSLRFSTCGIAVAGPVTFGVVARVTLSIDTTLWILVTSTVKVLSCVLMNQIGPYTFAGSFLDETLSTL